MLAKLRTVEGCATWPPTSRTAGSRPPSSSTATPPRDSASCPRLIDDTLYDAFGQRQVSNIYTPLNQYHVILEVPPRYQQNPDALKAIYVKSSTGSQVPLSAFAHFSQSTTPLAVNHQSSFPPSPCLSTSPRLRPGRRRVNIQAAERQMNMPASIRASFQGTAQAFQASWPASPS
jgi:multidrug efflux pump subunit AcrB